jgi:sulfatase maturation enzyme AslB (radical SAM superfamily)|tara:strand:+ start:13836 stop:15005 length:1170 start_codon:yes stop_codon:yes gene_type:complete
MRCSLLENGVFFYPEKDKASKDKPCCNFGTYTGSKSLHKIKITEIGKSLNDINRTNAIKYLDRNVKIESCNTCWKHEDNGYPSMRTRTNELWKDAQPGQLKYLDWNTGNTCNIQCIMCNPDDSLQTKAYSSLRDKYDVNENLWESKPKSRGIRKDDIDQIDFDTFKNLEWFKSTGGETFYSKEYWHMLDKLIEHGLSKNISLINVTNNTIPIDNKKLEMFKQFKRVTIFSSIDGVGELCDTIRAGSKWSSVSDNIKHLIELSKEYPDKFEHTKPHTVVQFANVLQLDEITNWWESVASEDYKDQQYFRLLTDPLYYDVKNLKNEVAKMAIAKYENNKKLKHVSSYIEKSKADSKYQDSDIVLNIFRESCKINNTNPEISDTYRIMQNGI